MVFEKREKPGGMMTYGIPSFKLSPEVVAAEIDILRQLGVEIRCNTEVGRDVTLQQLRDEGFCAFCLAIGAQKGRLAGVEGEEGPGVATAMDFLAEALGSPDATVADSVTVVGGGNVAIDAARCALRLGRLRCAWCAWSSQTRWRLRRKK